MALLEQLQRLAFAKETTYGVAETSLTPITAAEIQTQVTPTKEDTNDYAADGVAVSMPYGGQYSTITFTTPLYITQPGSSLTALSPLLAPLFEACALSETKTNNQNAAYSATDLGLANTNNSITLAWQVGRLQHQLTGGRGTFSIEFSAGREVRVSWEFQGFLGRYMGVAGTIAAPTLHTISAPVHTGATLVLTNEDTNAAITTDGVLSGSFELGNTLERTADITAESGFGATIVTRREPMLSLETRLPSPANGARTPGFAGLLSDIAHGAALTWAVDDDRSVALGVMPCIVAENSVAVNAGIFTETLQLKVLSGVGRTDAAAAVSFVDTTITL